MVVSGESNLLEGDKISEGADGEMKREKGMSSLERIESERMELVSRELKYK